MTSMDSTERARQWRLIEALATPPSTDATPDLAQLHALLAANAADGRTNPPWWFDSHEGGDEDGPDGYVDIGGIVAGYERTEHDHEGNAVGVELAVEELGMLHSPIAAALAVAAVNALPWLLAEVERLRAAAPTSNI